jgi:dihydropteroate synthase
VSKTASAFLRAHDHVLIMGVVNLTPDSFSDGGRYLAPADALQHGLSLAEQGADILDLGGESTRPGAQSVSVQEELDRVIPTVEALRRQTDLPISVDTSKTAVMQAAVEAGADMINDVNALLGEGALEAVAQLGVPVCLMHRQGEPQTMQVAPSYGDVVVEVRAFLADRASAAMAAGIPASRIVIDPGFGFGKSLEHNLALLRELGQLVSLGYPVLAGLSRKSMLGELTGRPVAERLAGSIALATLAAERGARILRVHDVAPTVDALRVLAALRE